MPSISGQTNLKKGAFFHAFIAEVYIVHDLLAHAGESFTTWHRAMNQAYLIKNKSINETDGMKNARRSTTAREMIGKDFKNGGFVTGL